MSLSVLTIMLTKPEMWFRSVSGYEGCRDSACCENTNSAAGHHSFPSGESTSGTQRDVGPRGASTGKWGAVKGPLPLPRQEQVLVQWRLWLCREACEGSGNEIPTHSPGMSPRALTTTASPSGWLCCNLWTNAAVSLGSKPEDWAKRVGERNQRAGEFSISIKNKSTL